MNNILALLSGLLKGFGLTISGMINPAKVLDFLDVTGKWVPTLAMVMAGALITTFIGYRLVWRWKKPMTADRFNLPLRNDIDFPLIAGAALFGLGWGIAGFCPGPAIAALTSLHFEPFIFIFSMTIGMILIKFFKWSSKLALAN